MFLCMCAALLIVASIACGGDLKRLAELRLRNAWLIFVGLAVQILVISLLPDGSSWLAAAAHIATYAAALVVVVLNRRIRGMLLLGLGIAANGVAIAANGGTLPATRTALAAARFSKMGRGLSNSGVVAHPHLSWLGDIMTTPSWLPLRNTMSVGDVLILAGGALLLWCQVGAWPLGRRSGSGGRGPGAETATSPGSELDPGAAERQQRHEGAACADGGCNHAEFAHPALPSTRSDTSFIGTGAPLPMSAPDASG